MSTRTFRPRSPRRSGMRAQRVHSSTAKSATVISTVTSLANMQASREQGYTLIDMDEPTAAEAPCPCPPCRCINCANRSYAELRGLEAPGTVVDILKPSAEGTGGVAEPSAPFVEVEVEPPLDGEEEFEPLPDASPAPCA